MSKLKTATIISLVLLLASLAVSYNSFVNSTIDSHPLLPSNFYYVGPFLSLIFASMTTILFLKSRNGTQLFSVETNAGKEIGKSFLKAVGFTILLVIIGIIIFLMIYFRFIHNGFTG